MSNQLAIEGGKPVREKMLPFGAPALGDEEINEVVDTLRSGWISTGPKTKRFEDEFAAYVGAKYAIALNSCTAGLHLSLVVNHIGPGDEVIVPALTFGATANVVEHVGARPVFVDVEPQTCNIDPARTAAAITSRTRAIIPVHYGGLPCDLDKIHELARGRNLVVIEDAAHAVGARYNGKMLGTISPLTNFSFYANKNLTTAEGGMITTEEPALEETLRVYHLHGLSRDAWKRYHVKKFMPSEIVVPGYKYNMTDVQASIGLHQLRKHEGFVARREELAAFYDQAFAEFDGLLRMQYRPRDGRNRHVLHLYILILNLPRFKVTRNEFVDALLAENIGAAMHFNPLHNMPYYRNKYGYKPEDLPVANEIGNSVLSLPLTPQMTARDAQDVVDGVTKVVKAFVA